MIPTVPNVLDDLRDIKQRLRNLEQSPNAYRPVITAAQQTATDAQATASDAQTTAQAASDTAGTANDTAVQAQQAATVAAGDASTALGTANDAKTLATGANTTSQTALDTANGAASDASTALSAANDASTAASQASNDAAAAQSTATAAQTAASQAQSDASTAIDAAGDAQSAAAAAASAASTAQSTANSKIRTYIQGTAPSSGMTMGDIWFDSSNGNRPSRWSGSAWVLAQDGSIATAQSAAEAAAAAAGDAQDAADAAQSTATAAQTAAGQAQTAADNAQDAADSAATAAADAAGLAGSKSVVYIQPTAPAGDPLNLWIDTTGGVNTPKRWNGTAWVAVTDKAATDAASAAAAAQSAADDAASAASAAQGTADAAQSAASAAQTTANSAQSLAASKTTTFRQTSAPSSSGRVVGDLWYDTDNGNALSIWSGSAWVAPYSHTPDGAYDLASTANSAAGTAQSAATAAQSAADDAQAAASAAQSAADSAQTDATNAGNAAAAAQSTANAANSAASTAQSTADAAQTAADTAQSAANAAQTTANGKNTIFRQATQPSTTGRTTGDLWFDTDDGNRPYVFASGAWTTTRDTTIATAQSAADSAASAASAAQSDADAAASAASTAQGTADSALTAANGKNKVTYSTNAPSGTGTVGDLWFQVDGTGDVTGQWQWTGSAWQSRQATNTVIANLDAGKITTGTIAAARLSATDIQAKFLAAGKVSATDILAAGSVTSASGVIGALDAGAITTGTLAAARIAAGSLDGGKITAGTITAGQLAANAVTAGKIAAGAVTAGSIAAGAIATGDLAAGAVTASKMAAGTITAASGIIASIDASKITTGILTGIIIQGTTIRTAASGARVEINGDASPFDADSLLTIEMSTDSAQELSAGGISLGYTESSGRAQINIGTPKLSARGATTMLLDTGGQFVLKATNWDVAASTFKDATIQVFQRDITVTARNTTLTSEGTAKLIGNSGGLYIDASTPVLVWTAFGGVSVTGAVGAKDASSGKGGALVPDSDGINVDIGSTSSTGALRYYNGATPTERLTWDSTGVNITGALTINGQPFAGAWAALTVNTAGGYTIGAAGDPQVRIEGNQARLVGHIKGAFTGSATIATIPAGYRPVFPVGQTFYAFVVAPATAGSAKSLWLRIYGDGSIIVGGIFGAGAPDGILLDQITYPIV